MKDKRNNRYVIRLREGSHLFGMSDHFEGSLDISFSPRLGIMDESKPWQYGDDYILLDEHVVHRPNQYGFDQWRPGQQLTTTIGNVSVTIEVYSIYGGRESNLCSPRANPMSLKPCGRKNRLYCTDLLWRPTTSKKLRHI